MRLSRLTRGAFAVFAALVVTFLLGPLLVIVLFAFGALQYARHPEGVVEFQKRRSTLWFERHLFDRHADPVGAPLSTSGVDG